MGDAPLQAGLYELGLRSEQPDNLTEFFEKAMDTDSTRSGGELRNDPFDQSYEWTGRILPVSLVASSRNQRYRRSFGVAVFISPGSGVAGLRNQPWPENTAYPGAGRGGTLAKVTRLSAPSAPSADTPKK